jgi:hypothetical protein
MEKINLKDMDVENPETGTPEENVIEKVITSPPSFDSEKKEKKTAEGTPISDEKGDEKNRKDTKAQKLKKLEVRLSKKYDEMKQNLSKWMVKEKRFMDEMNKKQELSNELKGLIERAEDLKFPNKNINQLKKVLKKMNRKNKMDSELKKIKNKIRKFEDKISTYESKME